MPRPIEARPAGDRELSLGLARLPRLSFMTGDQRHEQRPDLPEGSLNPVFVAADGHHSHSCLMVLTSCSAVSGYIPDGRGMPRMRQMPRAVPTLIRLCRGTGAWARFAGLTQTSCFAP